MIDPFAMDLDAHIIVHYVNGDLMIKGLATGVPGP